MHKYHNNELQDYILYPYFSIIKWCEFKTLYCLQHKMQKQDTKPTKKTYTNTRIESHGTEYIYEESLDHETKKRTKQNAR